MHDNSVCFNFFYYIPYKVHKKTNQQLLEIPNVLWLPNQSSYGGSSQGHCPLINTHGTPRESRKGQILPAWAQETACKLFWGLLWMKVIS